MSASGSDTPDSGTQRSQAMPTRTWTQPSAAVPHTARAWSEKKYDAHGMSISYDNLLEYFNLPLKTISIFRVLSDYFQVPVKLYFTFE